MKKLRLPNPVLYGDTYYHHVEISKIKSGRIAETTSIIKNTGNVFKGMEMCLRGCIVAFCSDELDDKVEDQHFINKIIPELSYKTQEYIMIQAFLLYDGIDGKLSGIYSCPLCKNKILCRSPHNEDEEDTRDSVDDLEVVYNESENLHIIHELLNPVTISNKKTGEVIQQIFAITYRYPTLKDCISAYQKIGDSNSAKLQFAIMANAITHINGEEVEQKWRNEWGMVVLSNIEDVIADINAVSRKFDEFGIKNAKTKYCPSCGEQWEQAIDITSFFYYGLGLN